jgi:hypothetical protein
MTELTGGTGTISFDGRTVTITRMGMSARLSGGQGERRIPIESISSIGWRDPGMRVGYIEFSIPGEDGWQGRNRAAVDNNHLAMSFTKKDQAAYAALRDAIEAARRTAPLGSRVSTVAGTGEIAELACLRDRGIISDKDFETAKRRLLGG